MLTMCLPHHQGCSETPKCAYVIYGQPLTRCAAGPPVRGGDDTQCNICPRMFSVTSHFLLPLLLSQHTIIPPPVTPTMRIIPVHQPRLSHQRFCTKNSMCLFSAPYCVKLPNQTFYMKKLGNWKHIGAKS